MKKPLEHTVHEVQIKYKPKHSLSKLAQITSPDNMERFLRKIWNDDIAYRESFYIVLFNKANKVIGYSLISVGGLNGTVADIRICLQMAILGNASAVVISHNHPSSNLTPSNSDLVLTERFKKAFTTVDIQFLDHIIISPEKGEYLSLADYEM